MLLSLLREHEQLAALARLLAARGCCVEWVLEGEAAAAAATAATASEEAASAGGGDA
jgi:hypothetical protein